MLNQLDDYSGPVVPDLRLENLSHDTLVKLAGQYARAYQLMDGHWYDAVAKRYGEQMARDLDLEVWLRNIPPTVVRTLQALGHEGKDMAAILKATQFHPAAGGCPYLYDYEVELKSPKLGIVKVTRCHQMRKYRDRGDLDFVRVMCREWDIPAFGRTGKAIIPDVKCRPLVLPPYDAPYERQELGVDCMWEYSLD
ncbi:MAG: DUF6125 family protein [Chloroflexi bacterium]|nr:DUF6125 family protein [Chloroflexota bacterium]